MKKCVMSCDDKAVPRFVSMVHALRFFFFLFFSTCNIRVIDVTSFPPLDQGD